jgi:hypothetical protein
MRDAPGVHPAGARITWPSVVSAAAAILVLGVAAPLLWLVAAISEAYEPGATGVTHLVLSYLWPGVVLCLLYLTYRNPRSSVLRGAAVGTAISVLVVAGIAVFLFSRR